MFYLVAYAEFPSRTELRRLRELFDVDSHSSVLPLVSKAFQSQEDALSKIPELIRGQRLGRGDGDLLVQPDEAEIHLSYDEALALVRTTLEWQNLQVREGEATIRSREYPRCWLILVRIGPYIPPGVGFVVDKYSSSVFPRRYIDVAPVIEG